MIDFLAEYWIFPVVFLILVVFLLFLGWVRSLERDLRRAEKIVREMKDQFGDRK